jgi:hypothetical protein
MKTNLRKIDNKDIVTLLGAPLHLETCAFCGELFTTAWPKHMLYYFCKRQHQQQWNKQVKPQFRVER